MAEMQARLPPLKGFPHRKLRQPRDESAFPEDLFRVGVKTDTSASETAFVRKSGSCSSTPQGTRSSTPNGIQEL
jgi:hypothetical protein